MEVTQEEYDKIAKKFESKMEYYNHFYKDMDENRKQQMIRENVYKHFTEFLTNAEKNKIKEVIRQNFAENHGYNDNAADDNNDKEKSFLPTGHLINGEIQVVVSHFNKFFDKEHMEKWYSQEYYNQLASIIKSKKL